jgi:hypothetical protein
MFYAGFYHYRRIATKKHILLVASLIHYCIYVVICSAIGDGIYMFIKDDVAVAVGCTH